MLMLSSNSHQLALTPLSVSCQSLPHLHDRAKAITVNLLSRSTFLGSGTLIERRGNRYTLVTNAHVLRSVSPPYQVRTVDGQSHLAKLSKTYFGKDDLVSLQFESKNSDYQIARFGRSNRLKKGEIVYASGFSRIRQSLQFNCRVGTTVTVLTKAIEGGYQVGYTNQLDRGMSGGPLFNQQGELIGINSLKADPLWEITEYYEDGSLPSPALQKLIERSSWAIAVERLQRPRH